MYSEDMCPVLSDVISLTTNRWKDAFIVKRKKSKLGLEKKSPFLFVSFFFFFILGTFAAWVFCLCLVKFIVWSNCHLHPSIKKLHVK